MSNIAKSAKSLVSRWPEPTTPPPSMEDVEDALMDGDCLATDGCSVELDGTCPHGHPSCAPRSVPTQSSREEPKNGVS